MNAPDELRPGDRHPGVCPTCGQPEVGAVLDEVEASVDAFFAEAGSGHLRIELDPELDPANTSVGVPRATLDELERDLLGVAQALTVLEGAAGALPDDLRGLLAALARDTGGWARRLATLVEPPP